VRADLPFFSFCRKATHRARTPRVCPRPRGAKIILSGKPDARKIEVPQVGIIEKPENLV
jgi:hypothetical protein